MIFDFFILEMRGRWDGINGKFVKERIIRHVKYYSIRSFFFSSFNLKFESRRNSGLRVARGVSINPKYSFGACVPLPPVCGMATKEEAMEA